MQKDNVPPSMKNSNSKDLEAFFTDFKLLSAIQNLTPILEIRLSLIDLNNELLFTSNNSEDVIGYSFDNFKMLSTFGYVHPDDREKVIQTFTKFTGKNSRSIIYRIFKPSGEMRYIRGIANKFIDEDSKKIIGTILLEFDLTVDLLSMVLPETDEANFKEIINFVDLPMLFLKNNNIFWTSQSWQDAFEYSLNDIKSKSIDFLFKNQDDYAQFLLECNKTLKGKGSMEFETQLITATKNNKLTTITAHAFDKNNLSKGIFMTFLDTKVIDFSNQEEIIEKLKVYDSLVNTLEEVMFKVENMKIEWVNDFITEMLLYTKNEVLDEDLSFLFQTKESYKHFINEMNKRFINNKPFVSEIKCIRKDRKPISFKARAVVLNEEKPSSFILILEPVDELRRLVNILREERSEIDFYTDLLFHDAKNYCQDALLQIESSLMKMETNPSETITKQQKAKYEILRIAELISNMDKFFKVKRMGFEIQRIDLYTSIEAAIKRIKDKYDLREIVINHSLEPSLYYVKGYDLLRDAFFNILDNAVISDRSDIVTIDIVISSSGEFDDYWKIEFLDKGPGIGDDLKKFLFDRYTRSKGSVHGSGFGLTLVKAIIDSLSGRVSVENRDPKDQRKGTKIIVELPKELENK
ncbi:MAG: PAS domain-containing protein [Asgard group archaeon]|nr:PAS domain-containing protein [Asgard group archaeon]